MEGTQGWVTTLTSLMALFALTTLISSQYHLQVGTNKVSKLQHVVTLVPGAQVHIYILNPMSPIVSNE